jgi:hypothetical protein
LLYKVAMTFTNDVIAVVPARTAERIVRHLMRQ